MRFDREKLKREITLWTERANSTQQNLAKHIGVSRQVLNRLINGTRGMDIEIVTKIANAIGVEPSVFIEKEQVADASIYVKYKTDRTPTSRRIAVYMGNYISDARNVFGIEVNTDDIPELANGTIIVVDEKEIPVEGDNVVIVKENLEILYGTLVLKRDKTTAKWLFRYKAKNNRAYETRIKKTDKVLLVVGITFKREARNRTVFDGV
ncbi:helix-turn-helix transcriptional regulator [Gallibacterium anatis]|uniref:helix-turn-helix transcriptional regulator n=1 Tax=Gallibacterium anatis TaxID=750 RepID=UPI003005FE69